MFEVTISDQFSNFCSMRNLTKNIINEVSNCKGLYVHELVNGREKLSIAVNDKFTEFIRSRIKDEIVEYFSVEYKYRYFTENLKIPFLDEVSKSAFYSALAVFDKDTDKKYVYDNLCLANELYLDSFFNFRLPLLVDRWAEIVQLVIDNVIQLAPNKGLIEMMKFLLKSSPVECDEVYVKIVNTGAMIFNARNEVQFFFQNDSNMLSSLIHQLITLLPKTIVVCSNQLECLSPIFEDRIKQKLDLV